MTTTATVLVAVGLLGLLVATLSARLRELPLSEPLLALAVGVVLGPAATGVVDLPAVTERSEEIHEIARVLLAISVMAVALRYPVRDAWRVRGPVTLLLLVVMPLMALATAVVAWPLGLGLAAATVLGCALCPTDPVLASSVVTGAPAERDLPARTRQVLSLESGANDGLALPLVLVALVPFGVATGGEIGVEIVREVVGALVLGVLAGWGAGRAIRSGERHGATDTAPVLVFTLVLALGVLGAAVLLDVGGVLAVFVAGLTLNATDPGSDRMDAVVLDEAINRFVLLPGFVVLGSVLPWEAWRDLGPALLVVVVGTLLLRRLPWVLLLRRPLRLTWRDAVFLGWFGPIGVSAVFYLALLAERLPAADTTPVLAAGTAVVAASTVVHGVSSSPGRRWYARVSRRAGEPG
ncbi:cation:proton antiporter domain-containing protein [Aeromicrobium sp. Sec7.5]|uniref:cation:proton antiporter domain-containing protein n=1 Tax=Aeromicrobium sp. Sec7.5 TaxID=3121276 RepID=UPI002FE4F861